MKTNGSVYEITPTDINGDNHSFITCDYHGFQAICYGAHFSDNQRGVLLGS